MACNVCESVYGMRVCVYVVYTRYGMGVCV